MILKLFFMLGISLSLIGNESCTTPETKKIAKVPVTAAVKQGWEVRHLDVSYEFDVK